MPAPKGNRNAAKGKEWEHALRHALSKRRNALFEIADKVVEQAAAGDQWAINHVAERLDGKPKQTIDQTVTHRDASALTDGVLADIASGSSEGVAETEGDPQELH